MKWRYDLRIAPHVANARIPGGAKFLWALLRGHAGKSGDCRPGLRALSVECGAGVNTVREWLGILKAAKFITFAASQRNITHYVLPPPTVSTSDTDADGSSVSGEAQSVSENAESVSTADTKLYPRRIHKLFDKANQASLSTANPEISSPLPANDKPQDLPAQLLERHGKPMEASEMMTDFSTALDISKGAVP